jgi:type VI secretion system protein ImpJ
LNRHQRPAWYEGMTLDPQHFQQWDRYHQYQLNARVRSVRPSYWGFHTIDIDKESLANGQFSLRSCCGVTQDGCLFDCPSLDPLPMPQAVRSHFPPSESSLCVYLGVPIERTDGVNCQLDRVTGQHLARYVSQTVSLIDDTSTENNQAKEPREVTVAVPSLRLLFGDEPREQFSVLPVAELVRAGDGTYQLSPEFMPPLLAIGGSDTLMSLTRRVLEMLVGKSRAFSERRKRRTSGEVESTTSDVLLLSSLSTVNNAIPPLNYHFSTGRCHPEALYLLLASLAGQLMTFSTDEEMRPGELPAYDHGAPAKSFFQLESRIVALLEGVYTDNFTIIQLIRQGENRWTARLSEEIVSRQLFLSVGGEVPERKIADELRHKIKIASSDQIDKVVNLAVPAVQVVAINRPPTGLPSRPGVQFFRIEKIGTFWDAIAKANMITIHLPAEFKGVKCELYAVKES